MTTEITTAIAVATEGEAEALQLASEIAARILNLESLFEESLKGEMESLKQCILANPNAAALLKDEDVGTLVANLRRTVSAAVIEANKPKTKGASKGKTKQQFTPEELKAALEAEGW